MDNQDILDIPQEEMWDEDAAPQAEPPETEGFTLKYMGEERTVGRDEALALAQKGMDYDRIRGRYERLKTTALGGDDEVVRRGADIDQFMEDYPDVPAGDIPAQVWAEVGAGRSLSAAWARHENRLLRAQMAELEGRERTTGQRSGSGRPAEADEFLRYLMN